MFVLLLFLELKIETSFAEKIPKYKIVLKANEMLNL